MARKVTEEDKILINELYIKLKTYAAVARETGFSPTTVKKYIIANYIPKEQIQQNVFNIEIPTNIEYDISDYDLCFNGICNKCKKKEN